MFSDRHAKRKNKEARRFNKKKSERKGKTYLVRRNNLADKRSNELDVQCNREEKSDEY